MKKQDVFLLADSDFVPVYASEEAAGADIRAFIEEERVIFPGKRLLIPTGIKMEIPRGFELQLRPRSGLAYKEGITLLNTPATIDSDYRGEIQVLLINLGDKPFTVAPKMRIAQAVLVPLVQAKYIVKKELCKTVRGEGGFGHTGTN